MKSIILLLVLAVAMAIPNPAAVNCNRNGYDYVNVEHSEGTMSACKIEEGKYVEAWTFFRGLRSMKTGDSQIRMFTLDSNKNIVYSEPIEAATLRRN